MKMRSVVALLGSAISFGLPAFWLESYNTQRTHSGKYCYGKTPMQTLLDSKHLAQEKALDQLLATKEAN